MQTIEMNCPNCGAPLKQSADKEKAVCDYCGYQMLLEHEDTIEEIREKAQAKSYGYHKGKLDAQAEASKEEKRRGAKKTISIVGVILLIVLVTVLSAILSKPKINPYDYIEVNFQGVDGKGEVVLDIESSTDAVDTRYIRYEISKDRQLTQGETIIIYASSEQYRLSEEKKSYVVEGLDEYLKDLTDVPQKVLEMIHLKAESELDYHLEYCKNAGTFESMKPVKLFLATDGKRTNKIYDVFEAHFITEDEEETYYIVADFSDVIIRDGEQVSMSMSGDISLGNYIQIDVFWIRGYNSLEEVRAEILTSQDSYMELKELDLVQN